MAELEDLSARLSRLAAAVPVASGRLEPVHRGAVEARQRVRMAWLTPLVVLVVGVTAFGLLQINPVAPGASPSPVGSGPTPEATEPPPFPSPAPVRGTAPIDIHVDDDFRLTLEAGDRVFRAGDPIQVEARYAYIGSPLNAIVAHFEPEVAYSIRQLDVPALIHRSQGYDSDCTEREMRAGIEHPVPLRDANLMTIEARFLSGDYDDQLAAGILVLPAGRWRISASLHPRLGGCQGEERDLIAGIDITVVPPGWSRVPIITASEPASACHLARHEGRIAPNAESGIGTAGANGTTFSVRWPYGWSGWRDADGVVLLDAAGAVVAREGDNVVMGGGIGADVDFYACSGIEEPGPP